jgi:3-deoxy-D-manno-octulosonic-acid transferase
MRLRSITLMRWLYTMVMYMVTPIIVYRLTTRGLKNPGYLGRWRERFGFFPNPPIEHSIWIHAVSVGEFNAAIPLIEALMQRFPGEQFVVTTVTPTGSERVQKVFGENVLHVYLPYDLPASIRRFLDRVKPRLALIMETEIWPNLYLECKARNVPIVIANARLSERSLKGYGPVRALARHAVRSVRFIAAQSHVDSERFLALGARADRLRVVGNIKYDLILPLKQVSTALEFRAIWGAARPVWIAASTHEPEEEEVLRAHAKVLSRFPDALMLVVPRHPERFKAAASLCRAFGFRTKTRSENEFPDATTQCFVVDSMGELLKFYAAADVAFVGGSLAPIGGHNVLEASAQSIPVIVGPHTFNFAEITTKLQSIGALRTVADGLTLGVTINQLLNQPALRKQMGEAGLLAVESERGAAQRIVEIVAPMLNQGVT